MVEDVESLEHKFQTAVLSGLEPAGQPGIQCPEVWSDADVAAGKVRPVGGVVPIVVQFRPRQQVEWARAVGAVNGSEDEIPKDPAQRAATFAGRLQNRVQHNFVPLIEGKPQ